MQVWPKRTVVNLVLCGAAFAMGYAGYTYSQNQQFARAEDKREEIRSGLAHAEDLATAFRQVGKVVEPSVVNISVRKKITELAGLRRMPLDPDELRRFFRDREETADPDAPEVKPRSNKKPKRAPEPAEPNIEEEEAPETYGTGSGVIMDYADGKGFILTNNHVAGGADEITITLADGRELKNAKLLGTDPKTDLAVIEVKADRLSPAKWGNSDELQKGDWIMAFGSPFGYIGSMTHGIVSALNRQAHILARDGYENFIQVDAPINPGNSGGPLVNLRGEVVGINTAIASGTGGFQGIGFAIPSNQARFVYSGLKERGKVTRGWLGVGIADVSQNSQAATDFFGYTKPGGVLVEQVFEGTPSAGKLLHGDIITEVNGHAADTVQQLRNTVAAIQPDSDVKMKIFRDEKETAVNIKLGAQPDDVTQVMQPRRGAIPREASTPPTEVLGMSVQTLAADQPKKQGQNPMSGVVILRVQRNSLAVKMGLLPNDIITEVNKKPIADADELAEAVKKADPKKGVLLYVYSARGGTQRYAVLSPEK
jgi:serine protease Do